jgi:MinD superfamily P-loop ATPase
MLLFLHERHHKIRQANSIATSNYLCKVDLNQCNSCEICIERCQVKAIEVTDDGVKINNDRCIGCGVCAISCPTECLTLEKREITREPLPDPKILRGALAMEMASKRNFRKGRMK